jgi:hypothetical protein
MLEYSGPGTSSPSKSRRLPSQPKCGSPAGPAQTSGTNAIAGRPPAPSLLPEFWAGARPRTSARAPRTCRSMSEHESCYYPRSKTKLSHWHVEYLHHMWAVGPDIKRLFAVSDKHKPLESHQFAAIICYPFGGQWYVIVAGKISFL